MYQLILLFHVILAISVIGLVLIQHGKGADIGAAFGSGASNTVFGSQGTGSFLFRLTGGFALLFFVTSVSLSYMVSMEHQKATRQVIEAPASGSKSTIPLPVESNTVPAGNIVNE